MEYYGNKAQNLYSHICAARAARGAPGDHGIAKHLFRNFFGLHSSINRTNILASGHESRCASEEERSHQILRSTEAMLRRQASDKHCPSRVEVPAMVGNREIYPSPFP